jgi:hypothetical protein
MLAANPSDPLALRNLGELALSDGNITDAVHLLKDSFQSEPRNSETREMLAQAVLEGLETDFSRFRDELPLIRRIASRPEHLARLARVTAEGLQATGDVLAALESYLRLAEIDRSAPQLQSMAQEWDTLTSRWIHAQLEELWQSATAEELQAMHQMLSSQVVVPNEAAPVDEMLVFLEYFGGIPPWQKQKRLVAERFVALRPGLEAELLVRAAGQADHEAWVAGMRSQLLHALGRHEAAYAHDALLNGEWAEDPIKEGFTGRQFVEGLRKSKVIVEPRQWPSGRVLVHRETIAGGEQHDRFQSIRIDGPVDPSLAGYRFFIDQVHQSLAVVNPYGELEASVPLITSGEALGGYDLTGRSHAVLAGHLLVVSFGHKIIAVDLLQRSSVSAQQVLWEASTVEPFMGLAGDVAFSRFPRETRSFRTYGAASKGYAQDDGGRPLGWIGPVGPSGVVFQAQGELRSVDPLTGDTNWIRRDVPPGCALFGDDQYVIALPHHATEAMVFRALDGKLIAKRPLPPLDEHYEVSGRRVVRWGTDSPSGGMPQRVLEVIDAWNGQTVWRRHFPLNAQICSVEGDWLGVMDQSGKFELLEIPSGEVVLSQQLLVEPILKQIFVLRSRDRIVLVTDRPSSGGNVHHIADGVDFPIVTGRVYVFSRSTGKPLLQLPAEVDRQGLALMQPVELPLMGFVSHSTVRAGGRGSRNNINLLVLNKETGSTLVRAEIDDASTNRFRLYPDPEDPNVVLIDLANYRLRVVFTGEAAAPEPPADSDVEGTRRKGNRGVLGLFSRASVLPREELAPRVASR